jgi:transcriptional regulator with XRE-family HTH domain
MNRHNLYGTEVKRLREGAELTQDELGALIACSKQHLSGIENGRSLPSPELARKLDKELGSGSRLFTLLRQVKVPDEAGEQRNDTFHIDGHLFFPTVVSRLTTTQSSDISVTAALTSAVYPAKGHPGHTIHVFPFNVAVVHEKHELIVTNLTDVARWRRAQIRRRSVAASDHLLEINDDMHAVSRDPYCFACLHLKKAPWGEWQQLNRAVQLLSCPSLLLDTDELPPELSGGTSYHEDEMMNSTSEIQGSRPFGFENRHVAWASWSGVGIHFRDEREFGVASLIEFEVQLQALWTLADHIDQTGETPAQNFGVEFLRRIRRKLRGVGATEHASERHMKEVLIETSRIIDKLDNALDALSN